MQQKIRFPYKRGYKGIGPFGRQGDQARRMASTSEAGGTE
jgi:hypothetical protein